MLASGTRVGMTVLSIVVAGAAPVTAGAPVVINLTAHKKGSAFNITLKTALNDASNALRICAIARGKGGNEDCLNLAVSP